MNRKSDSLFEHLLYFGTILMTTITVVVMALSCFCGCSSYQGATMTEGLNVSAGIKTPSTGGTFQLQLLTYISGFNLGVDRNAALTADYTISENNSYLFGLVTTDVSKRVKAKVEPCETTPEANAPESKETPVSK